MNGFKDREEAGKLLGEEVSRRLPPSIRAVVFGIPRGGVVVALEVARRMEADLDVIVPAKIRAPQQRELGLGAVAPDGSLYRDEETISILGVSEEYMTKEIEERSAEIRRRMEAYRGRRPQLDLAGMTAVLVDDGIATGGTAIAAARSLRLAGPEKVILAVPVAPPSTLERLEKEVDELICLIAPESFIAVGAWYRDFSQVPDEHVRSTLKKETSREL